MSQQSDDSQTAADFIRDQLQLEADAREALPYSIENCTKPLGPLRQNVFACLTCTPPPANPSDPYNPAGVCYSCSVQCHGEHELVEIFQKRNFTCDCGTTRFTPEQQCTLRINSETNTKGGVHSEQPDPNNKYNHNFRNRFCSCSIDYDPNKQVGTMYQCLGLGTHETGGCGEDWYHPGCLVGLGPNWYEKQKAHVPKANANGANSAGNTTLPTISEDATQEDGTEQQTNGNQEAQEGEDEDEDEDPALPDGFPNEDAFDHFICYKCVEAYPWIKRYAGTPGFLPAVFLQKDSETSSKKRKLEDDDVSEEDSDRSKRVKNEFEETQDIPPATKLDESSSQVKDEDEKKDEDQKENEVPSSAECKLASLPSAPSGQFSLFTTSNFREQFCKCASCFPDLKVHPQLLEEEDAYEPPLSDGASEQGSTHGSGSLYDRGESALKNVDRVRAIEGVMAYNHLKERLKPFFQQFAESGKAIGAEDIKEYFAKLRGDEQAIKEAGEAAKEDHRQEQSGY
ncbi:putative zinc finger in N-recognin-domain-containing protein [Daldinia vernicosa]|uniref:putative zinc finger in N-recognin-domain-containing protein n=1 Tax=Daldinia vernicosa TaxID=114800 RepID=UPI002007A95C|nr:putative zinc finger in N-recognin-domain-containing protein [Daldinia vernicosa]KAI0847032.1 putative zinc finger in N-recognin-domain-containing protein [Daldinia vernicosa]